MSCFFTTAAVLATGVLIVTGAGLPATALGDAAGETEQRLLACDDITDSAEKLACFDAVVKSLAQEPAATTDSPSSATPAAPAAEVRDDHNDDHSHDDSDDNGDDAVPATADAAGVAPGGKGEEGQPGAEEEFQATIVRTWRNLDGRFSVELDNGQIWQETQGTRVGMPQEGDAVEVSKGFFGGYRMKIESITPIAWVRRAK